MKIKKKVITQILSIHLSTNQPCRAEPRLGCIYKNIIDLPANEQKMSSVVHRNE